MGPAFGGDGEKVLRMLDIDGMGEASATGSCRSREVEVQDRFLVCGYCRLSYSTVIAHRIQGLRHAKTRKRLVEAIYP